MRGMDPQIESFSLQLTSLSQDLPGLAARLSPTQFNWRQGPAKWSVGQCVEHLNITSERYLPVLRSGIATLRAAGAAPRHPFQMGLFERMFFWMIEPPVRMRVKAPAGFVAPPDLDRDKTIGRWRELHAALAECIHSAEGADLGAVKVRSQFGPVSFTLGGTFAILLAHERRHTWQARGVVNDPRFPRE